jgi:ATP-dependent DNA helicase RecQ
MVYSSSRALELLRRSTHEDADFRTGQERFIQALCNVSARFLLIQPPGWGKLTATLVATRLLRDSRQGPVLYVTPLIVGMNHAVSSARRLGLVAETLNSSNADEWLNLIERAQADRTDLLAVSPERFLNKKFQTEVLQAIAKSPSLIVFDNAELSCTLSPDWRPEYFAAVKATHETFSAQRVLFLASAASEFVIQDLTLRNNIQPEHVYSGDIFRRAIQFQHIPFSRDEDKLAFTVQSIKSIPGASLVCAGTVERCDLIVDWLRSNGVAAAAFHAYTDDRDQVYDAVLNGRMRCMVSTMGFSAGLRLPKIMGLFHFDSPSDLNQYYRQLGMLAPLAGMRGWAFMLCSANESSQATHFTFFASANVIYSILMVLEQFGRPVTAEMIGAALNIDTGTVRRTLRLLELENPSPISARGFSGYVRTTNPVNASLKDRIAALLKTHSDAARDLHTFLALPSGHLEYLMRSVAPHASEYRVTRGAPAPLDAKFSPDLVASAEEFFDSRYNRFEPRKRWPSVGLPSGRTGFIPFAEQPSAGISFSTWMLGAAGRQIASEIERGVLSNASIDAAAGFLGRWLAGSAPVSWITVVPSMSRAALLADLARGLSERLGIPFAESLYLPSRTYPRLSQRDIRSSSLLALNVDQAFSALPDFPHREKPVLLVDDWVSSRWTFTAAASVLRNSGVPLVVPFALSYRSPD